MSSLKLLTVVCVAQLLVIGQAFADCGTHVVRRGDTLRDIAIRYFGSDEALGEIYAFNSSVIGGNVDLIEVGQVLVLPCRGDTQSGNSAGLSFAAFKIWAETPQLGLEADTPQPSLDEALAYAEIRSAGQDEQFEDVSQIKDAAFVGSSSGSALHVLTGGPFPPYVDETLEQGGMIPHMVSAALGKAQGGTDFEIGFVNDREALLDTIMPRGGFDLTFPWPYPDCSLASLPETARTLCESYIASNPIYEIVTEFYVRAGSEWSGALAPSDLEGAVVCRPVGAPVNDLLAMGLLPDLIVLSRSASPTECLRQLDDGEVDVASMDGNVARILIAEVGISQPFVVLDRLTSAETLHALALRDDPRSQEALDLFNDGLLRISESGEWFEIVNRHITVH
jgi:LysM domain